MKPYTKYVVTVWANYEVGGSVPSNNETVMTLEDVPGAPEGVSVGVVNNSAVLVEWEVSENPLVLFPSLPRLF